MIRKAQFEQPVIPSRWTEEERRYAIQVEEVLERMAARIEALEERVKKLEKGENANGQG